MEEYLAESIRTENIALKNRIKELEAELDSSITTTGKYAVINGKQYKGVLETKNPDIVITTRRFIEELLL